MSRRVATPPEGSRVTNYISLGVIAKTILLSEVHAVLAATGKTSVRQRDLPAPVVVHYVIALALYMQSSNREVLRCLLEGVQWLLDPSSPIKVAGKSGISQARTRRCGPGHRVPAPSCSGGSRKTCAWPATGACPTAPI